MHLGGAGVEQHRDELPHRVPAHDRVVDDHDAPARDLVERVELEPDPLPAQLLVGLDERAPDVAVLDQPFLVRDPRAPWRSRSRPACPSPGSASRGRRRRAPPRASRSPIRTRARVHRDAAEARVGPREVHVLEDAERAPRRRARPAPSASPSSSTQTTSPGRTSRTTLGADQIERAGLGGDDPVVADPARARAAGSRAGRGTRPASRPRSRPPSTHPRAAHRRSRPPPGAEPESRASSAAITSVSEVDAGLTPSAVSSSRSAGVFVEVPVVPERDGARGAVVDDAAGRSPIAPTPVVE